MMQHMKPHHSEKLQSPLPERQKLLKGQTTLTSGFASLLARTNARAKEIMRCIDGKRYEAIFHS